MTRRGGRDERVGWDAGEGSVVDRVLVISLRRRIVSFYGVNRYREIGPEGRGYDDRMGD